ncbi:hypothetical protein TNCV_2854671 [Trichonephila clavipes]|nr:hypothetical protein TNCV_2854671 [Trichonephila clavipes]
MHFPIVQPRQPCHVHVRQSRTVRENQSVGIHIFRLIYLPNSVRRETAHSKELYVHSFIPRQIQMTRKHNDCFPKRTRNVHAKVGLKKDGEKDTLASNM